MADAYAPRRFTPLPAWDAAGLRLKPYAIRAADAPAPPPDLMAAARRSAEAGLAAAAPMEGGAEGFGHVVLHEGEAGTWLLLCWWAHGDICCERLLRAEPGGTDFVSVADRPLMACVWEMQVLAHENAAWMRHMMREPPDPEGWEADRLPEGLH